jgi:plastocyanin
LTTDGVAAIFKERRNEDGPLLPPFRFSALTQFHFPEATLRRIFALLLATPLLANCSPDSTAPLAASGSVHSMDEAVADESWPAEENWFTPEGAIEIAEDESPAQADGEMSTQAVGTQAVGTTAAPAPGAVMSLGMEETGSPFGNAHDASWHANDRMNPGTVVINAGETVTFKIVFGHRVAVYNNGVQPKDIQPTPGPLLLYPVGRIFLQPVPTPQFKLRFTKPGKYLVVCAINKHFFEAQMWGWVHVR